MSSSPGRSARLSLRTRVLVIALLPSLALLAGGAGVSSYLIVTAWEHQDTAEVLSAAMLQALAAAVAITLIALLVLVTAVRMGNEMVRRLRRLEADALAADERLATIVDRLRAGEKIDVTAEVPGLDYGSDELGHVGAAFNQAHQTAVTAAVQEAQLREGMHAVFMNIARRSQSVVQRQLQVLDLAERAESDPDQLDLLFQIDHLSTRERRNAENLIILGGGQLGRQWRNPVPLIDVIRSAVAETEDYQRVVVEGVPNVRVGGRAVADLMHLLAELLDNAIVFSAPQSRVEVRSNLVGRGVVVEIVDQGIGMSYEQRETLNEMFRDPHKYGMFALSGDARIGFFVVSNLARRQDIRVTLVESPHGGVRVIVLVPSELLTTVDDGDPGMTWGIAPVEAPPVPRVRKAPARGRHKAAPPRLRLGEDRTGLAAASEQIEHAATGPITPPRETPGSEDSAVRDHPPGPDPQARPNDNPDGSGDSRADVTRRDGDTEARATDAPDQRLPRNQRGPEPSVPQSVPPPTDGRPPLPRRRRQANLAKQLRQGPAPLEEPDNPPLSEQDSDREAERARAMMSAFQHGTDHGRHGGQP